MSDKPLSEPVNAAEPMAEATIPLLVAGRRHAFRARIPVRSVAVHEAMPVLHTLCDTVVEAAVQSSVEGGKTISCGPGCGVCCRQLVPMSRSEAVYLRRCLETLPKARQAALEARFQQAMDAFREADLLEPLRILDTQPSREARQDLGLRYFGLGISCPFLEEGSCSIYPWRPMACREYLVTSPAVACAAPTAAAIAMVPLAAKPSNVLFRFDEGTPGDRLRWQPLTLLFDPTRQEDPASFPRVPGPRLVEAFLGAFARQESTGG